MSEQENPHLKTLCIPFTFFNDHKSKQPSSTDSDDVTMNIRNLSFISDW